jgi:predicted lactoylglutathione lyase
MTFGDFLLTGLRDSNLTAVIPVLPSRDIAKTKLLYERLGFDCAIASPAGDYLIIRRDWVEIHFWHFAELNPKTNNVSAYLRVANADVASTMFLQHGDPPHGCSFTPAKDKSCGMREAHFIDVDGNLINIGTPTDHSRWNVKSNPK